MAEAEGTPEPATPHHISPLFLEREDEPSLGIPHFQGQAPVLGAQGKNEDCEEGDHRECVCVCIHTCISIKCICI